MNTLVNQSNTLVIQSNTLVNTKWTTSQHQMNTLVNPRVNTLVNLTLTH